MKIRGQTVYSIQDRIERMVIKCPITHCWNWQGSTRNKYGRLIIGSRIDGTRKSVSAHRASYEAYKGKIPNGFYVCHRCDNPPCCNPDHLWLGTRQDNVNDREVKLRNKIPNLNGENHPNSKLTWQKVNEIRDLSHKCSKKDISKIYGVSIRTISDIINLKTWKQPPKVKE